MQRIEMMVYASVTLDVDLVHFPIEPFCLLKEYNQDYGC